MKNQIIKGDCLEVMGSMREGSVDGIITDPPYLYLNHKLDRPFDEELFFTLCKKVVKPNGALYFFGRGVPLAKWITICDKLGFEFKEEIVWSKGGGGSSPFGSINRKHELVMCFGKVRNVRNIDFSYDEERTTKEMFVSNIKRIISCIKKAKSLEDLKNFKDFTIPRKLKHKITYTKESIKALDRSTATIQQYTEGCKFSSVLNVSRDYYTMEHPTQKPVKLLSYLVELASEEGDVILDPFAGSGSTILASIKKNRNYIGIEIDEEYFNLLSKNIKKETQGTLNL